MNPANLAHLHLLLNHLPVLGGAMGCGLWLLALLRKSDDLKRTSLEVLFAVALLTIPAYVSGVAAQGALEDHAGVAEASVRMHQDAALLSFVFVEITGVLAWFGLWRFHRPSHRGGWPAAALLFFSVVTVVLMARTAYIGGQIRHDEIRVGQETAEGDAGLRSAWLSSAAIQQAVRDSKWTWAACESLHFIGLCLLFGVVLVVNLRLLGMLKRVSFGALHQLLPVGIVGFAINLVTGMIFFIAEPEQYTNNIAFYWKLVFLMLGGANMLWYLVLDETRHLDAGQDAPMIGKLVAASTIFMWASVLYFGRMLPYIGNAF